MDATFYHKLCITNILNGVSDGLSKFSHPSRVALIFAAKEDDPISVYDPQNILRGHESKLKEIFYDDELWRDRVKEKIRYQPLGHIVTEEDLALAGLISYGGCSSEFFYQVWLTNHHPDMCLIHPTERWLEQAACLLAHDYTSRTVAINSSDYVMKNYALQAIADFIVDERERNLGFDSKIQIPPVLDDILNISKTREEGAWARGVLFFSDPRRVKEISFITKIQKHERPVISNVKHIRKLLVAVENSDRKLVSDGCTIIGMTDSDIPEYAIAADFRGDHGFLKLGNETIASFFDGSFHSTTREAKMVELEELLLDSNLETEKSTLLFQLISHLVHSAGKGRYGCTLVIDLNELPVGLSGHVLDPPLSLLEPKHMKLAGSLLKIDGAVHITSDLSIQGFGCLLDGKTINWENMARGARYNSALRFSAANSHIIVVVVSADRPVSIIYNGIEINAFSHWRPVYQYTPEPMYLKKYLNGVML
ncbi:MAG: DNA integrity scanning protein DisA nucleotide-binding domain protein [Desulfobacula sp.]|nr:DNA integrity scanning protein DisA nucleotide-binding domain protein [Desulfobacula sp.]